MFDKALIERAAFLLDACRSRGLLLATAESCTGGLLAGLLTEIAGSSAVVDRGFVTYSNDAKHDMLGVPQATIAEHGAVSSQTALAMAEGVLAHSRATIAVSVTGIAGPGGATPSKPVGLVYFGLGIRGGPSRTVARSFGDVGRHTVRLKAVEEALSLLESAVRVQIEARVQAGP